MKEEKSIVCRCEDLSKEDVLKAIDEGYTDLEELRRKLRIGMGACQGRVCIPIVVKLLEQRTGKKIPKNSLPTIRPPIVPVSLGTLASDKDEK
ncbi:MAG: (2Fe-2S)-binding protein [Candidatus Thermoplasmatota archaeon]|nr:(2Fe-2S)-binding protein [Candidatus Thermoplasmatota archaeon]